MSVETKHGQYTQMEDEWELVEACCSGTRAVKELKTRLLPPADLREGGSYDRYAYKSYLARAVYTNITGRTRDGLVGAAFRKPPVINLPSGLEYLQDNADSGGQSLEQLSKEVLSSLQCTGREPLLVDYPPVSESLSEEEVRGIGAYIKKYEARDLINWKVSYESGREVLVLAVLREAYNRSEDEFCHELDTRYRVLRLSEGVYSQQVYENISDGKGGKALVGGEITFPKDASGSTWNEIPLFVVGSVNNDYSVDPIPLADIAHVNAAHYRNSADLEENCFIHSQLTLGVTSSLSMEQFKEANPSGIMVGAKSGHFLGESGGFTSVQANPNQLADHLMERKEEQMRKLGAKLVEKRTGTQTAEAARIDATGESSVLSSHVTNVEEGLNKCIEWCGRFMGVEITDKPLEMNREFFDDSVDPQQFMAAIQLSDRAIIAPTDLRNLARRGGMISEDRTDDEIAGEAETAFVS